MRRTISVSAVIRRTLSLYGRWAFLLLPLSVVVAAIVGGVGALPMIAPPPIGLLVVVVDGLMLVVYTGVVIGLATESTDEQRQAHVWSRIRGVEPAIAQLALVSVTVSLVIGAVSAISTFIVLATFIAATINSIGGAGLISPGSFFLQGLLSVFVLVVPALYLMTGWSLAAPIAVIERPGGLRALGRSREMVRGNRLRVAGLIVLLWLLAGAAAGVGAIVGGVAGSAVGVGIQALALVVMVPFVILAFAIIYLQLRNDAPPLGTA